MKAIPICFAFVLLASATSIPAAVQQKDTALVFKPAIDEIRDKVQIPILLPSEFPSGIRESDIKLARGTVSEGGYSIELYYSEVGSNATFAAGFGGSKQVHRDLPNTSRVRLANGIEGLFRPVSCGGSCTPANLWWEQHGAMYQIQLKLSSTTNEKEQQKLLVETANSIVQVRN